MKIESNVGNNYFKIYSESHGVAINKNKILKAKKSKCLNYFQMILIIFLSILILSILLILLNNCYTLSLSILFITFNIVFISLSLLQIISTYFYRKSKKFNNSIIIDKEGITDNSFQGIKMVFSWDKIKGVVIKKYSITILTDTRCYFYFDISNKDDIIKSVNKYGSKDLIIY